MQHTNTLFDPVLVSGFSQCDVLESGTVEQSQYPTNVTFPNSPYLDKFTVMGVVIVAGELVSWSCFCDLFNIISY